MYESERILIIAADQVLRRAAEDALRGGGYAVEGVASGAAAMARVTADSGWALLLDAALPDMTAGALMRALAARGHHPPFVVLTDGEDEAVAAELSSLGAHDQLARHLDLDALLPRVFGHLFCERDAARRLAAVEAERRRSVERYRALVEGLPDVIIRFDRDLRYLYISPNIQDVLGIAPDAFIGKTYREMGFDEGICARWDEGIRGVIASGEPLIAEFTHETLGGPTVFEWQVYPEFDEGGTVRSVISVSRDITTTRRLQADYRALFDEMQNGFGLHEVICDEAGVPVDYRFLEVNPAFERLTGLAAKDIVGRTVLEVLPATEPWWIETYGQVALTGEPTHFEHYSQAIDRTYEVSAYCPAPGRFACFFTDITERCRAQEALRDSERQKELILNATNVHIIYHTPDLRIVWANKAASDSLGQSRESLVGASCYRLWQQRDHPCPDCPVIKARDTGLPSAGERQASDGRWYMVRGYPVFGDDGQLTGMVELMRDITAAKAAAKEHQALVEQLAQAQKMEAVGRLAGGVAHDFNNMLAVILGRSQLALELTSSADPMRQELLEIERAAERSANLTRQLLAFARRQTISPEVLALNESVGAMLKMLRHLIGEDIELVWRPQAGLWPVLIDPSQVDQILANLCVNARDAIEGVGQVIIETHNVTLNAREAMTVATPDGEMRLVAGDYCQIVVRDDGCGMDDETQSHLFEPFFTTKGPGQGTGLGLATVYGIATQNEGFIRVESERGVGSAFAVHLPRHLAKAEQFAQELAPSEPARGHETILLVEDEVAILRMGQDMLERMGYHVLAAATPGEAMAIARDYDGMIHLLMTDVIMPEMDGRTLAGRLLTVYPHIKRLFTSGYTADVIAHHGVLDPGVAFLPKPYVRDALRRAVRAALDED